MEALRDLLEDEWQKWMSDVYVAQILCGISKRLGLEAVSYAEFIGLKQKDERSGQEIVDDLVAKMRMRWKKPERRE